METNPRESSVSEKGRASVCIKSKNISFLDIGLKVNIHNAYTQKQTKKTQDFVKIHILCMNTENL